MTLVFRALRAREQDVAEVLERLQGVEILVGVQTSSCPLLGYWFHPLQSQVQCPVSERCLQLVGVTWVAHVVHCFAVRCSQYEGAAADLLVVVSAQNPLVEVSLGKLGLVGIVFGIQVEFVAMVFAIQLESVAVRLDFAY